MKSRTLGVMVFLAGFFFVSIANAGKPTTGGKDRPATDVVCDGCVDTTDLAPEVNSALDGLSQAIDQNTSAISGLEIGSGVRIYAQGQSIGRFLGTPWGDGTRPSMTQAVWVLSEEGYVYFLDLVESVRYLTEVPTLYFSNTGCTGDTWVTSQTLAWSAATGAVFKSPSGSPAPVYYTPRGQLSVSHTYYSKRSTIDGCVNETHTEGGYIALPNDEAITGVPNAKPDGPFTIGLP